MRLTAIKLAGFKSFVDPTTFRAPSNLTGIVGPNGCGKSNIIDAVRWVMGEGSARVLRGELMSDVIFSGSSGRKPVGTATVELLFDNSDGQLGNALADYSEISVKRQVSRDGISTYTLNGARCRRKDVRDLFLGTGAGTTGYSIIVQGMISQVVDARPEEIRAHLEEAAGISKYKERRRETERRIGHTRDNLDRLSDLREEVENHLSRLKRQARAAERYKKLKQQRRELESRLLALQWKLEMHQAGSGREGLSKRETELARKIAEQRAAEVEMEKIHQAQNEASEALNVVQGELYAVTSDIARLEQSIKHAREMQTQQQTEYDEVDAAIKDLEQHMLLDRAQVEDLTGRLAELEPGLAEAEAQEAAADAELTAAEAEAQDWQERLEAHHAEFSELNRTADGIRARLEVLDERMATCASRLESIEGDSGDEAAGPLQEEAQELEQQCAEAAAAESKAQALLDASRAELAEAVEELRENTDREHSLRGQVLAVEGRLESLQALQDAGKGGTEGNDWLKGQGLEGAAQLFNRMQPQPGWEVALETVLGGWLQARVVGTLADRAAALAALENGRLRLVQDSFEKVRARTGTLAEKVHAPDAIIAMLNHVRAVNSLDEALEFLDVAGDEESAVTRKGEWIGPGWAVVARGKSGETGMLAREKEIESLGKGLEKLKDEWRLLRTANEKQRQDITAREAAVMEQQEQVTAMHRSGAQLESRLTAARSRIDDLDRRSAQAADERTRLREQQKSDEAEVKRVRSRQEGVLGRMAEAERLRTELDRQRSELVQRRDAARAAASETRGRRHELALETSACRASLDSLKQSLARMDNQAGQLQQRFLALSEAIAKARDPEKESRGEMDELLQKRVEVEGRLGGSRNEVQKLEERYRTEDGRRQLAVQAAEEVRSGLERARLAQQELELNARNLKRQVEALGADVSELAAALPENAEPEQWTADIERLGVRIERLEPVNLAAIQEYEEELERKEYLDAQHADLIEALDTLETAIAKIDRKTRTRFKDTYEAVNKGMQELFPRLFGGGHGYLELTGDDLLTTGVSIMARPPGKRVSSIHLLSGGEKALTAVAFIFAIFRLNPAPFCLLDEVDAPLDDANVGRFCDLVNEMSETVQFIIVTHNKITMEMVHQLSGVTMREPGVSRLVQVDIDEAARMAEA